MSAVWLPVLVGIVSGILSGMFGVGGGLITTPAIRLILGGSAMSAIATPLPVIIPTAVAGALSHARRGLADLRGGMLIGAWGAAGSVCGALLAGRIGGKPLLLATAVLIAYVAVDMIVFAIRGGVRSLPAEEPSGLSAGAAKIGWRRFATVGAVAGLYSGLLGLGGGFVIVPLLTRWIGLPMKRAVGTSLVAVALLAIPGSITHGLLGHVDWRLALGLALGVVPGALIGARITQTASERAVRIGFASLLLATAAVLAANELGLI